MHPGIFVSRTREKLGRTCDQIGRTLEPCVYKDISQYMHFDVVLSVFIHPCTKKKKAEVSSIQYSRRVGVAVCVRALQMCVRETSHSARLLLQQSRASFMLALCLRAVLILSSDT